MINDETYFPCFSVRESECRAFTHLAEPTKQRLFPLIRLQAWPREKAGAGGPVARSIEQMGISLGSRPFALDLGVPRQDLSSSSWASAGHAEISALHNPSDGHRAWCDLVTSIPTAVPTLVWADDQHSNQVQAQRLLSLGRGLVLRFRKTKGWNFQQLTGLQGLNFGGNRLLLVFDYEQLGPREDLTQVGLVIQNVMLAANNLISSGEKIFIFAASSFPSQFAQINPEYAAIEVRERVLFEMLRTSLPVVRAGLDLRYGDHASVFAAERDPAFRGAPRVDYPTRTRWIYHRCKDGYPTAVTRVRGDEAWDESLLCWGAQRIRIAAQGDMTGLNAQGPWVTIRINIHLHLQSHFSDGAAPSTDQEWID